MYIHSWWVLYSQNSKIDDKRVYTVYSEILTVDTCAFASKSLWQGDQSENNLTVWTYYIIKIYIFLNK